MPQDALVNILTAAVAVSAVAILLQTIILFGVFRSIKALREQVTQFIPKAEAFLSKTEKSLTDSRKEIHEITTKVANVLDTTQKQLVRVDDVLGDATVRIKAQLERAEMVLDDSVSRVHKTVVELNEGILRPLREINGLIIGLRVGLHHLLRGGRPTVAQATSDEEMFI